MTISLLWIEKQQGVMQFTFGNKWKWHELHSSKNLAIIIANQHKKCTNQSKYDLIINYQNSQPITNVKNNESRGNKKGGVAIPEYIMSKHNITSFGMHLPIEIKTLEVTNAPGNYYKFFEAILQSHYRWQNAMYNGKPIVTGGSQNAQIPIRI